MRRPLGDAAAPLPPAPPQAPRPPAAFARIERRLRASLQTLQARDQALLTLGILWVLLGTAWLARSPATFPLAHVLGLPPVLAWLAYSYALRRYWGFYLADYCYFANALAFALFSARLVLAPRAPPLPPQHDGALAVVFALCLGPLLWANVFWRTTLAFHSPDKMCSVFIHTVAPLACLALRWLPGEGAAAGAAAAGAPDAAPVSLLQHLLLAPLALYLLWQAAYLCVTELGRTGALLRSDARYETSLRFQAAALSRAHAAGRGGALAAAAAAAGLLRRPGAALDAERPAVKAFFMAAQALYTLATLALAALAWHSFPAAAAMVGGVLAHTVHQGAGFYVKVFAARYLSEAQASVEEAKGGGGSSSSSGGSGGGGGGSSSSSEAATARRSASTPSAAPEGGAAAGFGASAAAAAAAAGAATTTTSSRGAFCLPPSVAAQQASLLDSITRKARTD